MAITVIEPPKISFSNNPIILKFQADGEGVTNGVSAENAIVLTGPVVADSRVTVRWAGKEQTLRAADNPNTLGAEFPAGSGNTAHASLLASWFSANHFFSEDFVVTAGTNGGNPAVLFKAKKVGKLFNFSAATFSGGSVVNIAPGKDRVAPINESVYIELLVKKRNDADFVKIFDAPLPLEEDRSAMIDLSQEIHAQMEAEIPDFTSNAHFYPGSSWLSYMVKFAPAGGENFTIGQKGNTSMLYATMGGTSYESGSGVTPEDLFKGATAANDKLLTLHGFNRVIRREQPVFTGFLNVRAARASSTLRIVVKYSDNTTQTVNRPDAGAIGLYEKVMWPVGYTQLNLGALQPAKTIVSYTAQLFTGSTAISEIYTYLIDYSTRKQVRYFSYTNSYGVPDTLYCYGEGSSELKIFRDQAEHVLRYDYELPDGNFQDWDLQSQETASCSSGFIPFRYVTYFHDFFLSQKKHRVISGTLYPISVNTESLKKWADNDNQFAIAFDYQYNFRNRQVSFVDLEKELVNSSEQMPAGIVIGGSVYYTPPVQELTDNTPTEGSLRPITSDGVWRALQGLQPKLSLGTGDDIILGNGFVINAESFFSALEKDATVPAFAKSLTSALAMLNALKTVDGAGSGLDADRVNGRTLAELQDSENHTLDKLDDYESETGLPNSSDTVLSAIAKLKNKVSSETETNKPIRFHDLPIQYLAKSIPFEKTLDLLPYLYSDDDPSDLRIRAIQNEHSQIGLNVRRTLGLSVLLSGRITESISPDYNPVFLVIENYITGNQITIGLPISTVQVEESVPDFIVDLMITFQASTHDTTIHAVANRNIKMIIAGIDGPDPYGLDHAFQVWNINTWNLGTTEHTTPPVTEFLRFNPPANKFDGINPDTEYMAWVAQEDEPEKIYQFKFRTPAADQLTPVSILPEVEPELPACDLGPELLGISGVTPTGLNFNFNGNNVFGIAWSIKDGGTVIRSGIASPTSSVVNITFASIPPKVYELEIEGSTCSSEPDTLPFTVTGGSASSYTVNMYKNGGLQAISWNGGNIQLPLTSFDLKAVKPSNPNYGFLFTEWETKNEAGNWVRIFWYRSNDYTLASAGVTYEIANMAAEQSLIPVNQDTGNLSVLYYRQGEHWVTHTPRSVETPAEYRVHITTREGNIESPIKETRTIQFAVNTAPTPGPSTANKNVLPISSPNGVHKMEVITGGRVELTISNDGAITDTWPDIYTNGQRSLEILGSLHHVYYTINGPELANLNGVILPEGDYFIEKYYVRASHFPTFESMRSKPWELTGDRIAERVSIQMRVGSTGNIAKPTFYPEFVKSGTPVGDHKISGYKNMWTGVSHSDMFSRGATHTLNTGGYDFSIPSQRSFALIKLGSTGLSPINSEQDFYNAGWNYCNASGNTPEQLVFEELGEEWDNLPGGGAGKRPKIVKFFEGYRDAMIAAHPGMQLGDFNSFGGYGGLENLGEPHKIWENSARLTGYRQHLSSTEQARKRYDPGNVGFANDDHDYFTSGEHAVFNVCFRIYFFNASNLSGEFLPQFLYESEAMYIAAPDRPQMVFTWEMIQDMINEVAQKNGWWYYSSSPAGRLYVGNNSFDAIPPYIAHDTAFFSCFNMKGFAAWGDRSSIGDVEVSGNQTSIFGRVKEDSTFEYIGGTRRWKPEGGEEVTWEISNPSHIARDGATGQFSKYPLTGLDALDRGRRDYDSIHPVVGEKHWAKFSTNGGSSWYTPNPGSLGTKLSSYGAPNFNTANPVLDIFANKHGVAIICVTSTTVTCVYKNTFRTVLQTENVVFQWEGKNYNLGTCRGTTLYVQTFTK